MQAEVSLEDIAMSAAFTGYRPGKLPFGYDLSHPDAIRLREALMREYINLINHGYRFFLTGGALGSDLMAAEVILELKREYPDAKIAHMLCAPCYHYTAKWPGAERERLDKIASKSLVSFISQTEYYNGCMQKRNRYMVDTSRVLLAVYDGLPGGTKSTVEYARSKNKKLVIINPRQLMRIELIESAEDIRLMLTGDDKQYR